MIKDSEGFRFAHLPLDNPLHYFPRHANSLLDIGCNVGAALEFARNLGIKKLYGVEINETAVEIARSRLKGIPDIEIYQGSADEIPIGDSEVEVALCSEVLEHIPACLRPIVVQETYRVLSDNGLFLITVPSRGFFHFLDPANFRLLFPNAFSIASRLVGGSGREKGFENQKHGIVWHHHFTIKELESLLSPYFKINYAHYRGCFLSPVCNWLEWLFYRMNSTSNIAYKIIHGMHAFDMSCNFGQKLGYNVLLVAQKQAINADGLYLSPVVVKEDFA